ncbi:hypothetical protein F3Y22_tig00113725pilonHSYRG00967 [Hibiscus syriacus]|uniref:MULE transposase domain-containing protein n=1 Tax=Hibiscus syriacus TaxID=106335 RepID=A0A6A2X3G5_HIBSY|nr:hypothetical protein F3Y22_tig00113725pilonHSYRG00967 [Hibiscus syriacus]
MLVVVKFIDEGMIAGEVNRIDGQVTSVVLSDLQDKTLLGKKNYINVEHEVDTPVIVNDILRITVGEGVGDCAADKIAKNVVNTASLDNIGDAAEQGGFECDGGGGGIDAGGGGGEGVQETENTSEDDEESDSEKQNAYSMDVPYLSDGKGDDELQSGRENIKDKNHVDEENDSGSIENDTEIHDEAVDGGGNNGVTEDVGGNDTDYYDSDDHGSLIRPTIGLDGCFFKGTFKGILLSTVGRDGNDQMYPIIWVVIEGERTNSWSWFISIVATDLRLDDGFGYTIISDQYKSGTSELKKRRGDEESIGI